MTATIVSAEQRAFTSTPDATTRLLTTVLDAVSDRVLVLDAQGSIVMINAALQQSAWDNSLPLGCLPHHLTLGSNYLDVITGGGQPLEYQAVAQAMLSGIRTVLSGQTDSFSLSYPCHISAQQRWFTMKATPLAWAEQRGVVITHADITPTALVKEALRQGELRFHTLFDSLAHVPIQGYAPDGTVRYWNQASERLYGYTAQQALGANLLDLIVPAEIRAYVEQAIAEMVMTQRPIASAELNLLRQDGTHVSVLSSYAVVQTPGQGIELFSVDTDMTARQQAQDALRESEQRFSSIANATPVMIWLAGTDTLCHWFNAGWLTFTGRTMAQEQGHGWTQGVHPDDLQHCISFYLSHFEQRLPFQMEYRLMHHSGQYRWIHDSGVPRFDAQGEFLGYIGSCVDSHEVRTIKDQLAAMAELVPGVLYQFVMRPGEPWQFNYLSKGVEAFCGVCAELACRDHTAITQLIPQEERLAHHASLAQATRDLVPWLYEHRIKTPQGELKWVRAQATPQAQPDGSVRWTGLLTDITPQKAQEERLRLGASVFDNIQETIIIADAQRVIVDVNAAFTRVTGYTRAEVLGRNPKFLKSGHHSSEFYQTMWQDIDVQGFWIGEVFNRNKAGLVYAVMLNINAVRNDLGQVTHYVGVSTDINQLKLQQEMLERVAHYDALTQLPNRVLLADRLHQAIAQARRNQTKVAVCYLDLDGFKPINDTLGHAIGDGVLKVIAWRMNEVLRASDTAARIGGDEFIVLLSDNEHGDNVRPILDRLLQTINQPIEVNGHQTTVSASIGVSLYPDHACEADTLLRQADIAMYRAKIRGKNCYSFSPSPGHSPSLD